MKTSAVLLLACLSFGSGCKFGKNAATFPVAKSASGTTATLQAASGTFTVELLAVRDDGLIVQDRNRRMLFFPYDAIQSFVPESIRGDYVLSRGERPSSSRIAMLKTISHYPQGLNAALERTLLDKLGQRELITQQ